LYFIRFIFALDNNEIINQAVIRKTKSSHRGAGACELVW